MKDLETNDSPSHNELADLWLGSEHREGHAKYNSVRDAGNGAYIDPGRSDAV